MKLVINDKLIKRNKLIGNITSFLGIGILAAGLILNLKPTPTRTIISFVALVVGFIVAQISTYFVGKFGRNPRYDEIMTDNLGKLNNSYTFYVYSSPVPMLLVGPSRIWIPIPVAASGEITYDKKWRQRGGSFIMKLFGQESIGRPGKDVKSSESQIQELLEKHLEETEIPQIKSILVTFNPKATIGDVENAPTTIVESGALRRSIRKVDRKTEEEIQPEVLDKINALLAGES